MKSKISRILGVGLMVAMLASMFVVGTPASAAYYNYWTAENTPTAGNDYGNIVAAVDIVDLAMAGDGTTLYAATGSYVGKLYKSLNSGATWTAVATAPGTSITKVAIAPDSTDGSVLAIIADTNDLYYSIDGGATWTAYADLNPVAESSGTTASALNCIAFSRTVGITKTLAVGGMNTSNQTGVWYIEMGALISHWVDAAASSTWDVTNFGNSQAAWALGFSPTNFAGDRALAVVTGPATTDAAGDNLTVKLQVANFFTKQWNGDILGFTSPTWGTGLTIDAVTSGNVTQSASLALDPNFLGQVDSSRLVYVGLATNDTTTPGGVYRFTNTTKAVLLATTTIHSVALNAAGDKLVAGACATNYVYRVASPATAASTGVFSSGFYKNPAGPAATDVVVAWMGTSVIAGTSGAESAFSVSKDDGKSFNDISLVDTTMTMKDLAVSPDGTKVYLVTSTGTYVSLWKTVGAAWQRVLVLASSADFLVRAAPENFDVAYLAMITTPFQIFYTNDGGNTTWLPRYFSTTITDMAVESATVVYVLSTTTVSKSIDGGLIWNGGLAATAIKAGFTGATLNLISAGNLLVGSTDSRVAYSTDGNVSWTVPVPAATAAALPSGTAFATADKLSSGGFIYMAPYSAANLANVYRWNIGVSTSWAKMRTTSVNATTGITYANSALYVINYSGGPTYTTLYRTLYPTTTTSDSYWSATMTYDINRAAIMKLSDTPQALLVGPASKLWAIDTLYNKLETYGEYLTYGPTLVAPLTGSEQPIDIATGRAQPIIFQFKQLIAAAAYQLQIATDITFNAPVFDSGTVADAALVAVKNYVIGPNAAGGQFASAFEFLPDTTYYWRVRAAVVAGTVGTPDSPWSAVFSFKMGGIQVASVSSPAKGAYDVPITPSFVWTETKGAVLYELEVSTDSTFTETPVLTATPDKAYYQTAEADALDYNTTYYWRVRVPGGTWVYGVFTTMAEPTTPAPAFTIAPTETTIQVVEVPTTPAIPTYLLWIIVAIGAVLVIALLVLIIRTRRAA